MKRLPKIATLALALGLGASPVWFASPARADQSVEWLGTDVANRGTEELRRLTAPVALYPDAVLAQVLVENAVVGGIGGVTGMAMVSLATALLGSFALKSQLAVGTPIVLIVIAGVMLLTMVVAALVAWGPSRVRPLEVLRYE